MKFLKPDFKKLTFHGRWERTDEGIVGHWCRPYFEFSFTGTQFTICTNSDADYRVAINNNDYTENGAGSTLTRFLPQKMTVNVRVTVTNIRNKPFVLKGIKHDGEIKPFPSKRKHNCLFIGDFYTTVNVGYSVEIPTKFDYDYTVIAHGELSLCNGRGYVPVPTPEIRQDQTKYGLESAFFFLNCPSEAIDNVPYNIDNEKFDMIFINCGTNDGLSEQEKLPEFKEKYVKFVNDISNMYPQACIYLLLPVADNDVGLRIKTIEEAAYNATKISPKIKYISSKDWDIEICQDNLHPTNAGYKRYSDEIIKAIGLK